METLCLIDAGAFFQIMSIPFNPSNLQHSFLLKGGLVSHELLFSNLSKYCMMLQRENPVRINFLCFISSLGNSPLLRQDRVFFFGITLELLECSEQLVLFNKRLLQRQNQSTLCKLLS
jgi:hypothetical protein